MYVGNIAYFDFINGNLKNNYTMKKQRLPLPTNQEQEVLYELLTRKHIDRKGMLFYTGILNLTARISDLRGHNIAIHTEEIRTRNKFGRKIKYAHWSLIDKNDARLKYLKMVNQN